MGASLNDAHEYRQTTSVGCTILLIIFTAGDVHSVVDLR